MKLRRLFVLPLVVAMIFAGACGDDDDDGEEGQGGTVEELTGDVRFFWAGETTERVALQEILDDEINAKVDYTAMLEVSNNFEQDIKIAVEGGNPPDIAMYPQPGSVIEQAKAGKAIALEDLGFDIAEMKATYGDYFMGLGEYNGKHYGLPTNANLKSMIWYAKDDFDAKGYQVPKTWDELIALSDKIVADGGAPWCIGIESGGATGWTATDWMEDIILRTAGPDVYDKWLKHEIPFNDPAIVKAGELFGKVLFTNKYVLGGSNSIAGTHFGDATEPLFSEPAGCYFNRQATFIAAQFPEEAEAGVDYDWFPFPPIERDGVLMGGELSVVFRDTPAVRDALKRFAGVDAQCAQGGKAGSSRVSPNKDVKPDCYTNKLLGQAAGVLTAALQAGTARFDASDGMPSAVGSGSFWTEMTKYTQDGLASLKGHLDAIEASWPK